MSDLFEHYILTNKANFKYAQGKPSAVGREFHDYDEIVWFLEGKAQFVSKDMQRPLSPGMILFIPKEHFHQFQVTNPEFYRRCVLGFSTTPDLNELIRDVMRDVMIFEQPTETTAAVFHALMRASQTNLKLEESDLLLQSAVTQVLLQQKLNESYPIHSYSTASPVTRHALAYIDDHYADGLTLDRIAKELCVSVSSLSHNFRHDLGLSVYRYLSEKRLSVVRQLVQQDVSLTEAARSCGYKDYSGFFRLYKTRFGHAPSASKDILE